jgi:diguanylate cyclase
MSTKKITQNANAQAAFLRMKELNVDLIPDNFKVWYEYCAQSTPGLNGHIDKMLLTKQVFTALCNEEIYNTFFGSGPLESVESMQNVLEGILLQLSKNIDGAKQGLGDYGNLLEMSSEELKANPGIIALQEIVARLTKSTTSTHVMTNDVSQSVSLLTDEVQRLNLELEAVTEESLKDPLTGLANRRMFDRAFIDLVETINPDDKLTVLMMDIDHFKKFNDTHGHATGDLILRFVASVLGKATKGADIVSRYGGEEFALLLPNTSCNGGVALAETIRKSIAKQKLFKGPNKDEIGHVTISIGVSEYRRDDNLESLLQRADEFLYRAKNTGRNKVCSGL